MTDMLDLEAGMARVQADNDRLNAELRNSSIAALEASSPRVDERLNELQALLDDLDRPLQDIERFDVEGGYVYMIQDKVLFDSGSAELGEDGKTALIQLAREIGAARHGRIFVRGHTDTDPVKKPETVKRFPYGNLQLSAARAVSVGHLLETDGGIAPADVVVMGFGQHFPIAANDSAGNKRLNRRVEIFVADV